MRISANKARKKMLVVCNYIPYPPFIGVNVRTFNLIKQMSKYIDVTLLCRTDSRFTKDAEPLKEYCREIHLITVRTNRSRFHKIVRLFVPSEWRRTANRMKMFLQGVPFAFLREYVVEYGDKLRQITSQQYFDVIQFDFMETGIYLDDIKRGMKFHGMRTKTVLVEIDITSVMVRRRIKYAPIVDKVRLSLEYLFLEKYEKKMFAAFDHVVAMSEVDRNKIMKIQPKAFNVTVIKNGVDINHYRPARKTASQPCLVFIGSMKFNPNIDGIIWFVEKILPKIQAKFKNVTLEVIGEEEKTLSEKYRCSQIQFHGIVDNLETKIMTNMIFICPIRIGAGTKLKVVTAMALGLPVVSTTIGVEGIQATENEGVIVADTDEGFAESIIRLLQDAKKCKQLGEKGRRFVEKEYAWEKISEELLEMYLD